MSAQESAEYCICQFTGHRWTGPGPCLQNSYEFGLL